MAKKVKNIRELLKQIGEAEHDRIILVSAIRLMSRHPHVFKDEVLDQMTELHEEYRRKEEELREEYDVVSELVEQIAR